MPSARPRLGSPAVLAGYAALLLGMLTVGAAAQQRNAVVGLWLSEAIAIALPAFLAVRWAGLRAPEFLGLRRVRWEWLAAAALLALCDQPVVSFLTWASRELLPGSWLDDFDAKQRLLEGLFAGRAAPIVATVVTAAPLGEELFFRGFAWAGLRRLPAATAATSLAAGIVAALLARRSSSDVAVAAGVLGGLACAAVLGFVRGSRDDASPWGALLASAALFSALHFDAVGFVGLFEIGLLCAALRRASGSLWPAVVAHAVNNGVAAGAFALGYESPDVPPPAWLLALGGVLTVAFAAGFAQVARRPAAAPPVEASSPAPRWPAAALGALWGTAVVAGGVLLLAGRR